MCRHQQQNMAEKKHDEGFEETALREATHGKTMAWIQTKDRRGATDLEKTLLDDLYGETVHIARRLAQEDNQNSYFDELYNDIDMTYMSVFGEEEDDEDDEGEDDEDDEGEDDEDDEEEKKKEESFSFTNYNLGDFFGWPEEEEKKEEDDEEEEKCSVVVTRQGDALEGETAIMMPFFYVLPGNPDGNVESRQADDPFMNCIDALVDLGDDYNAKVTKAKNRRAIKILGPGVNTVTRKYGKDNPMTVFDMVDNLMNLKDETVQSGVFDRLRDFRHTIEMSGGRKAASILISRKQVEKYQEAVTKNDQWQLLFWHIFQRMNDKAKRLLLELKKGFNPKEWQFQLVTEQKWNFDEKSTYVEVAASAQNVEMLKLLKDEMPSEEFQKIVTTRREVTGPNNKVVMKSLLDRACEWEYKQGNDNPRLELGGVLEQQVKDAIENGVTQEEKGFLQRLSTGLKKMIQKEQTEEEKQRELANQIINVLTPKGGKPSGLVPGAGVYRSAYNDLGLGKVLKSGRWDKYKGIKDSGLTSTLFTERQFEDLKLDCLFGYNQMEQTVFQLNPLQKKLLHGEAVQVVNNKLQFGTETPQPALTAEQKRAGLKLIQKSPGVYTYSFKEALNIWKWVVVNKSCQFYRLRRYAQKWYNPAAAMSRVKKQFTPYDAADLEEGELALCNTKEWHSKILDKMDDEAGKVLFMDKTMSAKLWLERAGYTAAGPAIGAMWEYGQYLFSLGDTTLDLSTHMVGLGVAALSAYRWYNWGEDVSDYKYCRIVRLGKRPKEEEIGKPGQTTAIIGKVGVAAAVAGAIAPGKTTAIIGKAVGAGATVGAYAAPIIGKAGAAVGAYAATWIPTGAKLAMDLAIERAGGAMETISITVAEWTSTGFNFVPWLKVLETIKAAYATVMDTEVVGQATQGIRQLYDYMLSLAGKTPEYIIDSLCSLPDWLRQNLAAPYVAALGLAGAAGIIYLGSSVYKWIKNQKTKLLGTSIMDFGYVLSRDLTHDKTGATPDAITKWQIHEAIMQGLLKAPEMQKGMYKPQDDNDHTLQFLTPAMVEGRAARTDFALHF